MLTVFFIRWKMCSKIDSNKAIISIYLRIAKNSLVFCVLFLSVKAHNITYAVIELQITTRATRKVNGEYEVSHVTWLVLYFSDQIRRFPVTQSNFHN